MIRRSQLSSAVLVSAMLIMTACTHSDAGADESMPPEPSPSAGVPEYQGPELGNLELTKVQMPSDFPLGSVTEASIDSAIEPA